MFDSPRTEAKARLATIAFAILNIDAPADWDDLFAAIDAVMQQNNVFAHTAEDMFEDDAPDDYNWQVEFEKEVNTVAVSKSFNKFYAIMTRYYNFATVKH